MQETEETWIPSLGREDPLEEGVATHCSVLAWGIPWTEEPGGLQSMGLQRVRTEATWHSRRMTVLRLPSVVPGRTCKVTSTRAGPGANPQSWPLGQPRGSGWDILLVYNRPFSVLSTGFWIRA